MEWFFAKDSAGWPQHFICGLEIAFVVVAFVAFYAASAIRNSGNGLRSLIISGGVLVGAIAVSFPILLAPIFFSVRGEWMMATIPAMIFVLPFALFVMYRLFKLA